MYVPTCTNLNSICINLYWRTELVLNGADLIEKISFGLVRNVLTYLQIVPTDCKMKQFKIKNRFKAIMN